MTKLYASSLARLHSSSIILNYLLVITEELIRMWRWYVLYALRGVNLSQLYDCCTNQRSFKDIRPSLIKLFKQHNTWRSSLVCTYNELPWLNKYGLELFTWSKVQSRLLERRHGVSIVRSNALNLVRSISNNRTKDSEESRVDYWKHKWRESVLRTDGPRGGWVSSYFLVLSVYPPLLTNSSMSTQSSTLKSAASRSPGMRKGTHSCLECKSGAHTQKWR